MIPTNRTKFKNPYSSERQADSRISTCYRFFDTQEQLEEIITSLTNAPKESLSYWILGEYKMGKTSLLSKIEDRLLDELHAQNCWKVIPLYISCNEHRTALSFYRGILKRIEYVMQLGGIMFSLSDCKVLSISSEQEPSLYELLDLFIYDLSVLLAQYAEEHIRFALLIDHAEKSDESWIGSVFNHLKRVLTDPPTQPVFPSLSSENLAVVLTTLPGKLDNAICDDSRLGDVLKQLVLRPLYQEDIPIILNNSPEKLSDTWADKIFQASAGHPWLVQYIMEIFCGDFLKCDINNFKQQFNPIITEHFQKDHHSIFHYWFDALNEGERFVLAHLLQHERLSLYQLSEKTHLDEIALQRIIRHFQELGIVYTVTISHNIQSEAYAVGDIFRKGYMKYLGFEMLQQEKESDQEPQPFWLLATLQHNVIITDGLYMECFESPGLSTKIDKLTDRAKSIQNLKQLKHSIDDLREDFVTQPRNWVEEWHDYCGEMKKLSKDACFIFRTGDRELFDFPIELLEDYKRCISLNYPMYKEIIGFKRARRYHCGKGCFGVDQHPLNILLVANNCEGSSRDRDYPELPLIDGEISQICQLWLSSDPANLAPIGKIIILSNDETEYAKYLKNPHIVFRKATSEYFEQALKGELEGVNGYIDVMHYSGHYIYDNEEEAGFLFYNERNSTDFFSLTKFRNALITDSIRFAYFSACASGQHISKRGGDYLGIAYTCLQAGIPVVIGMRWPITDSTSQKISTTFYEEFLSHGIPEQALKETRRKMENFERGNNISWAAPVMLTC